MRRAKKIRSETSVFEEEVKAVLCEINVQDDAMIARNVCESFENKPDMDVQAMKPHLIAG